LLIVAPHNRPSEARQSIILSVVSRASGATWR